MKGNLNGECLIHSILQKKYNNSKYFSLYNLPNGKAGKALGKLFLAINNIEYFQQIISDIDLTGKQSLLNKNTGLIGDDTTYPNRLLNYDNTNYSISDWDSADIWLIEIDGMFHNLVRETGPEAVNGLKTKTTRIRINSDYATFCHCGRYSLYCLWYYLQTIY